MLLNGTVNAENYFSVIVLRRLVLAMKILACNYLGFATSFCIGILMTQKSEWALYVGVFVMFILACWWYKGYCNLQKYKVAAFILFMVIGTRGICKTRQSWNMFLRKPKKMESCPNHHEQNIQYSITITHSHFFYFQ